MSNCVVRYNLYNLLPTLNVNNQHFKIWPVVNLSPCHSVSSNFVVVLAGGVEPLELPEGVILDLSFKSLYGTQLSYSSLTIVKFVGSFLEENKSWFTHESWVDQDFTFQIFKNTTGTLKEHFYRLVLIMILLLFTCSCSSPCDPQGPLPLSSSRQWSWKPT